MAIGMDRGEVDLEGLHDFEIETLKSVQPSADVPFNIAKMGHAVLMVRDIDVSVHFYTQVLGSNVSDVYPGAATETFFAAVGLSAVAITGDLRDTLITQRPVLSHGDDPARCFGGSDARLPAHAARFTKVLRLNVSVAPDGRTPR